VSAAAAGHEGFAPLIVKVSIYNSMGTINLSEIQGEHFCSAPWTNLHINNHEQLKPCCGGHGLRRPVDESWSYLSGSDVELNDIKHSLLNNQAHSYCDGCYERSWYTEATDRRQIKINDVTDFSLYSLDVRWSSTCQLSCTYCNEGQSSTWAQLKARQKTIPIVVNRIGNDNKQKLWDFLESQKGTIKRIAMLGGEPLLLKENLKILDMFDESVKIEIMSNLNLDLDSNEIYQRAVRRPNVRWHISMENIGTRFEFVRRGSDWNLQQHNIKKLHQEFVSEIPITIQSQYCAYSALHLPELYDWFDQFDRLNISLSEGLTNPECLNFFQFPVKYKQQSLDDLEVCAEKYHRIAYNIEVVIQKLKDNFDCQDPAIVNRLIDWHQSQESKYFDNRFDFLKLWPEYA